MEKAMVATVGMLRGLMPVLERDQLVADLETLLAAAGEGNGSVVLLDGEAGSGKSTVVRVLMEKGTTKTQVLAGYCDPLTTPRPLGPLIDIAANPVSDLEDIDSYANPYDVFADLLDRLRHSLRPILMVVEDVHWADDATLDMLTYLGRRIGETKAMVIATYRGAEVGPNHPLHSVLGNLLSKPQVHRFPIEPLSVDAIGVLIGDRALDAEDIHRLTGGNAFYVSELLASIGTIPATVQEAVLARVAGLGPGARQAVDAVAIAPRSLEMSHIELLAENGSETVEKALHAGILIGDSHGYRFRHEIARLAIEDSVPAPRRRSLHRRMLELLKGSGDPARQAHHAIESGDRELILEYCPRAAQDATQRRAHHEAARFYDAIHPHIVGWDPGSQFDLLEQYQLALYMIDNQQRALEVADQALEIALKLGDPMLVGKGHQLRSRAIWLVGKNDDSLQEIYRSIAVLESLGDSAELAQSLYIAGHDHMLDRHYEPSVECATRSLELAQRLDLPDQIARATLCLGTIELVCGDADRGIELIKEGVEVGLGAGYEFIESVGFGMLGTGGGEVRRYEDALRWLDLGIEVSQSHDEDYMVAYNTSWKARIKCEQGEWDQATKLAEQVIKKDPVVARISQVTALGVVGRVRVRRGDPGAEDLLRQALEEGKDGALQHIWAPLCALAEFFWLRGQPGRGVEILSEPMRKVLGTDTPWGRGEISYWMWRLGGLEEVPNGLALPFRLMVDGDWEGAAEEWEQIGAPYERALALSQGPSDAKLVALEIFDSLGARPAGQWLRSVLRDEGVDSIPRGPRETTRNSPWGLTARQTEVYRLVAAGLTNSQIADRLFISQKTVEHHVSAVMAKLDVSTRAQAVAMKDRLQN